MTRPTLGEQAMPYRGPIQQTRWSNLFILFCVIVQAMVVYGAVQIVMQHGRAMRHAAFAETRGEVIAVDLRAHVARSHTTYTPVVTYRYQVGGTAYRGVDGGLGAAANEATARQDARARYPAGRELPVYYNRDDPAESVLYREPPPELAGMFSCFGLVSLLVLPGNVWALTRLLGYLRRTA